MDSICRRRCEEPESSPSTFKFCNRLGSIPALAGAEDTSKPTIAAVDDDTKFRRFKFKLVVDEGSFLGSIKLWVNGKRVARQANFIFIAFSCKGFHNRIFLVK